MSKRYQNKLLNVRLCLVEFFLYCICWSLNFGINAWMETGGLILLWVAAAFVQTYGKPH